MKRSVRMLFSIFFGFSVIALCFLKYYPGASQDQFISRTQKPSPVFNTTLLTFAAFDLADYSLRRDVEKLLDDNFGSAIDKDNRHHLELRSPEFNRLRLESKRYLQEWWDHRQFNSEVMLNMVRLLDYRRKYKTCAVVGNSGILLQSNQGEAIDSHEFVVRINNARVIGFERFVGSKTNISFTRTDIPNLCSDEKGCICHPYGKLVPVMMYISKPVHFLDYVFCNSLHKGSLMIIDPQLDVLCARIVKYYSVKRFVKESGKSFEAWSGTHWGSEFHYSSGMQAVMLALGLCENVSIFGFGKSDSAKHHYHNNQKNETSLHDYQAEYDLYEDLVKSPENVPFVSDKFKFPPVIMYR